MSSEDFYSVLCVLPDAEDVVVAAAYRALAQRYHPDRWSGDKAAAHQRMSDINRAYAVLGDQVRRKDYDAKRTRSPKAEFPSEDEDESAAFTSALDGLEKRWSTAETVFPDLVTLRARLAQISTSLAFCFVSELLESKAFSHRAELASHLEQVFLERYFGTNRFIVDYARSLIVGRERQAAMALNRLVEVVGSDVDHELVIARIDCDFDLEKARTRTMEAQVRNAEIKQLRQFVRFSPNYREAAQLAEALGYSIDEVGAGFFSSKEVVATDRSNNALRFKNRQGFVHWVQNSLCNSS